MAEAAPFIGILGFGLTVCKDLYTYYHAFKGFDSSISSAYESIAEVAKVLVLHRDSCNDPDIDRERKDRVAACICSCEDALANLNEKLQQLKIADPEGFRQESKALYKRHAFPFKKESLDGLRNNAVEVPRRLMFAIRVLDIEGKLKSHRVLRQLEAWSSKITATVDQIANDTNRLCLIAQTDEVDKILAWLSPPDPWTNHNSARDLHEDGTGRWVLESDAYQAWRSRSIRHLWLSGTAGCGKTILSSTIVEDLQHHCQQEVTFGIAPFYFSFSDRGKQSYEALLRSLVAELGTRVPGLATLQGSYDQRHTSQGGLSVARLETILIAVLASYDTVFVVLDALDECPQEADARSRLFDGLNCLAREASNVKFLMTSRDHPDIRDSISDLPAEQLPVKAGAVDHDIRVYVEQQLSRGH